MVWESYETNGDDSYATMVKYFTDRIRDLKALCIMRPGESFNSEWEDRLEKMTTEVLSLEKQMAQLKALIQKEKPYIPLSQDLKSKIAKQREMIDYMEDHLPNHLPGNSTIVQQMLDRPTQPTYAPPTQMQQLIPTESADTSVQPARKKGPLKFERIAYITKDELDNTERYIKGRLTLEKVNKAIDEIHEIIEAKYRILSTPYAKLTGASLQKYKEFREQETKDTRGVFFFTDTELKNATTLKLDATGRSILAVLRHLTRVRDLGGSLKRYAIVASN